MLDPNDITTAVEAAGELSKPLTVFIERMSDFIGGAFRPTQIKRLARAEAIATVVRAHAAREVIDVEQRGVERIIAMAGRAQANLERITEMATIDITATADPARMNDDWIANFFDKSQLISDGMMQTLWAGILAREANVPGAFSKRTLGILADFDKEDADLFTTLCRFNWKVGEYNPLIFDQEQDIYQQHGITHDSLVHLEAIGLVTFSAFGGYCHEILEGEQPDTINFEYFDRSKNFELGRNAKREISIGRVILTKAGSELRPVCGAVLIEGFYEYAISEWTKTGCVFSS